MISQKNDNNEEEIEVLINDCYGCWLISNKANKLYELRRTKDSNYGFRKRSDPILIQIYFVQIICQLPNAFFKQAN